MDKIKILIADYDDRFTDYAVTALKTHPEIEVVSTESNGVDALQYLKRNAVDVVLFDLLLPGLDGISLLRCINEMKNPPATVCCTRFYSDIAMETVRAYGASYMMYKPIEAQALPSAIISSAQMHRMVKRLNHAIAASTPDNDHARLYIRNHIVSLGIPTKLIGCTYLTEAILLAKRDMMLARNLSRGLYLEIARSMRTTPSCVERSIRNAISSAYSSNKLPANFLQCPSNKEFIRYILQNLPI